MNTNVPLTPQEEALLAAIIESRHCDLLHETFRADNAQDHEAMVSVLEQRKLLEGLMDKLGLLVRARAC